MGHMRKGRLSQHKQGRLIEHFVAETTARTDARPCGVHRNTAAYYHRRKMVVNSIVHSESWHGYNVLDMLDFHHFRINHSKLFADRLITSMALRISGTRLGATCVNLTVFPRRILGICERMRVEI